MVKEAKQKRKDREIEDAKNQAADLAVNKMMQGGEFNKILADIKNAAKNQKKDKFSKKYALLVCNQTYSTKAGLDDLPQTKNDFDSIRRTTTLLNVPGGKYGNVYALNNKGH